MYSRNDTLFKAAQSQRASITSQLQVQEGKHSIQLQPFCTHTNNDTRDSGSIPGLGISSGVGNGNLLQYSCLENSMNRRAWQAIVHKAVKSWT